jgi:hypothetical protein
MFGSRGKRCEEQPVQVQPVCQPVFSIDILVNLDGEYCQVKYYVWRKINQKL